MSDAAKLESRDARDHVIATICEVIGPELMRECDGYAFRAIEVLKSRADAEMARADAAEARAEAVCRKLLAPITHECERYGACSQCMIDSQREDLACELMGDARVDKMRAALESTKQGGG